MLSMLLLKFSIDDIFEHLISLILVEFVVIDRKYLRLLCLFLAKRYTFSERLSLLHLLVIVQEDCEVFYLCQLIRNILSFSHHLGFPVRSSCVSTQLLKKDSQDELTVALIRSTEVIFIPHVYILDCDLKIVDDLAHKFVNGGGIFSLDLLSILSEELELL